MPQAETLFKPLLKYPFETVVGGTNAWCNRTAVASGTVAVTVSTNLINSDSLIFTGVQAQVASSAAGGFDVTSIVPGVSFAFTTQTGIARPYGSTVMWWIINPKP